MQKTSTPSLYVVIMAAGKGTRMLSQVPKVLQQLADKPMLQHVLRVVDTLTPAKKVVVTGHEAQQINDYVRHYSAEYNQKDIVCVLQQPQLGTAHAVMQALPEIPAEGITLIVSGDVPLIQATTLQRLIQQVDEQSIALLTVKLANPFGYGRIIRQQHQIMEIVEEKDATEQQRQINEVYTGFLAVPSKWLKENLVKINNHNQQQEYYLTDIVDLAKSAKLTIAGVECANEIEISGVNTPQQLAQLERAYQLNQAHQLMARGVRLADPARLDVRGELSCGQDVTIDINCIFSGKVTLADRVKIGANCIIRDANIAPGTEIKPFSIIEGHNNRQPNSIGENCVIGPFARLRPLTSLANEVHIGNFVELKNSTLGDGSKANHLAYLGDATVGSGVNYGAGSITANYDGANKHVTKIEDNVHIGSNAVLVAPVVVGQNGTVAAGSIISKNTAPNSLTLVRAAVRQIDNWQRPVKNPQD